MRQAAVIDSSVWIEFLGKGELFETCEKAILGTKERIVPTLVIFEVYRKILRSVGEDIAVQTAAYLSQFTEKELTINVALVAGDLSIKHNLAMADSIVLAHAQVEQIPLITLDFDFAAIDGVINLRRHKGTI